MSKFLIHIHSGPDLKNKATLGMLVAVTAFNKGNEVNVFLAADGVHLLNVKNDDSLLDDFNAEFAMPDKLLELSTDSNAVLCY